MKTLAALIFSVALVLGTSGCGLIDSGCNCANGDVCNCEDCACEACACEACGVKACNCAEGECNCVEGECNCENCGCANCGVN